MVYEYQLKCEKIGFEEGVELLKQRFENPVVIGAINNTNMECVTEIVKVLSTIGIPVRHIKVNKKEFFDYILGSGYIYKCPDYYKNNFYEKTIEHFLCYSFLDLNRGDKFIDIASENSPVKDIFHSLTGCITYSQDIMYKSGIHGDMIGSNASDIPVPDHSFNAAIATCSIEHFEKDSDILFMKEMERILVNGGKVIIAPLYLYSKSACQTDPKYSIPGNVSFDDGAIIYCTKDWGNRHGRFYSPESLFKRLIEPNKKMDFVVYVLENVEEIDPSIYCKFFLVGTHK